MNNNNNYVNLTALGKLFGAGPRDVGLWLKEMGLREQDGRPSQKAIKEGFVWGSQWLWSLEKSRDAIDGQRPPDTEYGDGYVLIRGS
jgi:hypothetical protein